MTAPTRTKKAGKRWPKIDFPAYLVQFDDGLSTDIMPAYMTLKYEGRDNCRIVRVRVTEIKPKRKAKR